MEIVGADSRSCSMGYLHLFVCLSVCFSARYLKKR